MSMMFYDKIHQRKNIMIISHYSSGGKKGHMYAISVYTERLVTPQSRIVRSGDLPKLKIRTYRNINQDATMLRGMQVS